MADIDHRLSRESVHRVGVVQAAPVGFDTLRTMQKVADLTADATRKGARLTLFPEAFISAYPRGLGFGAVVGARTPAGREQFRLYWESAIEVPGPHTETLSRIARTSRTHLVIGVIERDGGTLYCTVLFFGPDGRYLGKHRKLMPTASERLIWGFGDGSTLTVLQTDMGRVGAVICWENYMPLLRTAMYAKGVEIYCAPTADGRDTWVRDDAARRAGGALLRPFLQSIRAPARLPGRIRDGVRRRSGCGSLPRRELHHRSARADSRWPRLQR